MLNPTWEITNTMCRKIVAIWVSLSVMFGLIMIVDVTMDFTINASGATIYVNKTGIGGAYTSIQDAINNANPGDTVFVYYGIYFENVVVDKTMNLTGEDRDTTIIFGNGIGDVVTIDANWINLTGFTIKGSGSDLINIDAGIELSMVDYCKIFHNNVSDNNYGIHVWYSDRNNISDNKISSNDIHGVYLYSSSYVTVSNNNFTDDGVFIMGYPLAYYNTHTISTNNMVNGKNLYYYKDLSGINIDGTPVGQLILANCTNMKIMNLHINNTDVGIEMAYSTNTIITGVNITNNWYGIYLSSSSNNNIIANDVSDNMDGIWIYRSSSNIIKSNNVQNLRDGIVLYSSSHRNEVTHNIISNNERDGIYITLSSFNFIFRNNISSNTRDGINIFSGSRNNITNNDIFLNGWIGLNIYSSSDNRIFLNNFIDNVNQAVDDFGDNIWNDTYPSGGNYWSDYSGTDLNSTPTQDVPPPDGIGDTPYVIDTDSQDNYPLMDPVINLTFLYEGWNLVSIPYIQPETKLGTVLSSISSSHDAVQYYDITDNSDPWKHNHTSKPNQLNDLKDINHTMGFWIHVIEPGGVLLKYPGIKSSTNQSIPLHPGWNLVGYPSLTNRPRETALNNIIFGMDVDAIQWYDAATKTWHFVNQDDFFVPGRGYWVHSKVDAEWEVPL
jgi:parallel beta-helix repeat protein